MCMHNESFVIRILVSGYWFQTFMIWRNEIKKKKILELLEFIYRDVSIIVIIYRLYYICVTLFIFTYIMIYCIVRIPTIFGGNEKVYDYMV